MQPGGGLVFVTRQAQSKIDKVLQSSSRAMADILRPFLKLQEKTVASSLTCYPGWTGFSWGSKASKQHQFNHFFSPSPLISDVHVPASPHPWADCSTLLYSSVCSFGGNKSGTLASPSSSTVLGQSQAVRTVLDAFWEDQRVGTVLKPEHERPRLPSEDGIGSLTSSLQSPLYL